MLRMYSSKLSQINSMGKVTPVPKNVLSVMPCHTRLHHFTQIAIEKEDCIDFLFSTQFVLTGKFSHGASTNEKRGRVLSEKEEETFQSCKAGPSCKVLSERNRWRSVGITHGLAASNLYLLYFYFCKGAAFHHLYDGAPTTSGSRIGKECREFSFVPSKACENMHMYHGCFEDTSSRNLQRRKKNAIWTPASQCWCFSYQARVNLGAKAWLQ